MSLLLLNLCILADSCCFVVTKGSSRSANLILLIDLFVNYLLCTLSDLSKASF
jgi:hypothetical protein